MFQYVGLYWIIDPKEKLKFYFDLHCHNWILIGTWYDTTIFSRLRGYSVEDYFTTAQKYRYNLMCYIEAYEKLHLEYNDDAIIGGGRPLIDGSTTDTLISLDHTLNSIDSWIQSFEENYYLRTMMYLENISELFRNIPLTII